MQPQLKVTHEATDLSQKQADSLAKKRARDRRAQQNQRDKRNEQVRLLQEQLTRMEGRVLQLSRECELLRQENQQHRDRERLRVRQSAHRSTLETSNFGNSQAHDDFEYPGYDDVGKETRSHLEFWSHWPGLTETSSSIPPAVCLPIKLPYTGSETNPWTNTPAHGASDTIVTETFKDWLRRPDLIHSSPEQPRPVELLYGSKTNFLADMIHQTLRSWPCGDPERLASGWLIYYLIKWMLRPSPEKYARLRDFQVPVIEQLEHTHAYFIDFVHWPQLRVNMIRHGQTNPESIQDVLGMFLCCLKLRWPWGQNFLIPEQDGTLTMRQDFFEIFTNLDGWGLTDDFFHKFPALAQGLDMSKTRYRIC